MIVSVTNLKGGTGKTTTAIALATAAARAGIPTSVIDTDVQSSASMWAMLAAEGGDPLPFPVDPGNIATVRDLGRHLAADPSAWVFVDCPPSGAILDEAVKASDFVVVPTTPHPADVAKTLEAVATLEASGTPHAVLIVAVRRNTVSYRECLLDLDARGMSRFEAVIPMREDIGNHYANGFGSELYGYTEVLYELRKAIGDGD